MKENQGTILDIDWQFRTVYINFMLPVRKHASRSG